LTLRVRLIPARVVVGVGFLEAILAFFLSLRFVICVIQTATYPEEDYDSGKDYFPWEIRLVVAGCYDK